MKKVILPKAAQRVVDLMKNQEGFLSASQGRLYAVGVDSLMDLGKITFCRKNDLEGFKLIGFDFQHPSKPFEEELAEIVDSYE